MRGKDLLECMEHIDDALIEEALHPVIAPRQHIRTARWGMAAACLFVAGISAAALWSHRNIREDDSGGIDHEVAMMSSTPALSLSVLSATVPPDARSSITASFLSFSALSAIPSGCALPAEASASWFFSLMFPAPSVLISVEYSAVIDIATS